MPTACARAAAFGLEPTGDAPQKTGVADTYPMNYPEEDPKLSKLPFIVGDLALLGAAALIAYRSSNPITPIELLAITLCVALGAALLVIPFLVNYARRQDAVLSERQNQIAALASTTAESVEQVSIAVAGIHTLINSIPKPKADAPAAVAPGDDPVVRRLAQLDAATKTQSEALAAREKALAAALAHATRQIEVLLAATAQATAAARPPAATVTPPTPATPPSPATPALPAVTPPPPPAEPVTIPAPQPIAPAANSAADVAPASPSLTPVFTAAEPHSDEVPVDDATPSPPKAARARKAKPADTLPDLGLTSPTAETMASAPTADGATRLLATAYIGIGQTLYLRGDGPGLSWEKGVPLQFVSIGKWLWESSGATTPFSAKL